MNRLAMAGYWMLDYGYTVRAEAAGVLRLRGHGAAFSDTGGAAAGGVGARGAAAANAGAGGAAAGSAAEPLQVVLLPGVFERAHFMRPIARRLARSGHRVHLVPELGRNTLPIALSARIVADRLARDDLRNVVLVAHSKGGLIGKYVMLRLDPDRRVQRLVAVNTPFSGSHWARYLRVSSVRMFAADDLTVTFLGAASPVNSRITSVYGTFDQNVRAGSVLPGARNIRLPVAGHSRIIGSRALGEFLDKELAAPRPVSPAHFQTPHLPDGGREARGGWMRGQRAAPWRS
ncbi:hypothetical protein B7R21_12555 [Subtercola boreus]|uniref:Alpha/beta hydrolase n=1 Tax=Subtercola boreus TaxID=120213 RepID=A0A3E0VQ02_9MICO|nr:alpha/beta hydrolase [Subtercola boreus]RFA11528.1 hypothetical protein B7R21_12555 [Subtercola boreus]